MSCPVVARRALVSVVVVFGVAACSPNGVVDGGPDGGGPFVDGGGDGVVDSGYPPPSSTATDRLGEPDRLDVAAWNIAFFPRTDATPSLVADVVTSLDMDLVCVEEITDIDAWDELVARLPEHEGLLSSDTYGDGTYQKIGFLYRSSVVTLVESELILTANGYELPRPPLQARFTYDDGSGPISFVAIGVHFKAGRTGEDFDRREASFELLEAHVADLVSAGISRVVILGDFNEHFDNSGTQNWAPFAASAAYEVHTRALDEAGQGSFLPGDVMLDHIVTTSGFADAVGGRSAVMPRVDQDVSGYETRISDHLPVTLGFDGT